MNALNYTFFEDCRPYKVLKNNTNICPITLIQQSTYRGCISALCAYLPAVFAFANASANTNAFVIAIANSHICIFSYTFMYRSGQTPSYMNVWLCVLVYVHICELSDLWSLRFALHFDLKTPKFSLGALAANSQLPHNCNNTSLLVVCMSINMCKQIICV